MNLLRTPIKINKLELNNRLVMPPMATGKADDHGRVTPMHCAYYNEKSSGGYIGLIITEHTYVSPEGKASKGQLSTADDEIIEGLKNIAQIIHNNGTKAMVQINHAGGAANSEVTGKAVMGADARPMPVSGFIPEKMSQENIKKVVYDFTQAALRVKKAGFDGVEIHSAHGYLLNQFFSPLTNQRNDEYGGSLEKRIKLHIEIIQSIRKAVGEDYTLALRLGACDYMEGGITLKDSLLAVQKFEQAGLDLLDISGGFCRYINPLKNEQGYFSELTEAIKREVAIPVILTGGITEAEVAERLLKEHKADLIGVGRAILKDSLWAKNAIIQATE